jgi:VanZ family protein
MTAWLYGWRWQLWAVYGLAWTVALLTPVPISLHSLDNPDIDLRFLISKGAHVSAYVFWAAFTGWLRAPVRFRFVLMFCLMAHATVTEVLQYATELGRTGALLDVAFDHTGIAIGTFATWNWWTSDQASSGE